MVSPEVTTELTVDRGVVTVHLGGDLDVDAIDPVRKALASAFDTADATALVIDLAQTEFLDSTALGTLVGAYRTAGARGWTFRVVNLQGQVERLLAMTGTLDLLTGADPDAS